MAVRLSKSKLIAFRQCPKRLWLEVNRPDLGVEDDSAQQRFQAGHRIGELARTQYADGVLIAPDNNLTVAVQETEERIRDKPRKVLFEATFEVNGLLVRADLLIPAKTGWHMVEVKSSSKLKDYHVEDAAIQYWVAREAGLELANTSLLLVDTKWTYPGGNDYSGLLKVEPIDDHIRPLQAEVQKWLRAAQKVAGGAEPKVKMGKQCNDPFACGFQDYCETLATPVEYPISWLPRLQGKKLAAVEAAGIVDLRDLSVDGLTDIQCRVHRATLDNEFIFEPLSQKEIKQFAGTRYYLDFETISFAAPIWAGSRPYQQVPFQFHCDIEDTRGSRSWTTFLDVSGNDPSRACAEALVNMLGMDGMKGPIIAYNAGFEKQVIKGLAARFEDLAPKLNKLLDRLIDLLPLVAKHYYHPSMQGSWSIKSVLPTIAPDLHYSYLGEVADGDGAQRAYLEAIHESTTLKRKMILEAELVTYCARDVEAMICVLQYLEGNSPLVLIDVIRGVRAANQCLMNLVPTKLNTECFAMTQHKVRICKYHHGNFKGQTTQNFTVNGNTEGAVKEYLQEKHPNEQITVIDTQWAS